MSNLTLFEAEPIIKKSAQFSPCRTYRYELRRVWDRTKQGVNLIMLNPSTADEIEDDPTIRRCISFARDWGYGGFVVTNLFAFRATKPKDIPKDLATAIGPENDNTIRRVADECGLCVAAWGSEKVVHLRQKAVCELLKGYQLHCIQTSEKGQPNHPLYQPGHLQPIPWRLFL